MHTAYASELEQNTLSSVCPILATVVHSFFVFYAGLLLIFEKIKYFEQYEKPAKF